MTQIYKITNLINNKSYIGKTNKTFEYRFKEHIAESKRERCKHRPLYRAFSKYGIESFSVELIEEVDESISCEREIYWISTFSTFKFGYNATLGGDALSFIDKELVVKAYEELGNGVAVAKKLGCHVDSVYDILSYAGVTNKGAGFSQRISVIGIKDDKELEFDSMLAAATYVKSIREDKNINTAIKMTKDISLCCRGIRKSAYGYKWKYKE